MKKLATLFALMAASIYGLKAQIAWPQNGTSIYYNGGNVGIGTTTPSYPLHVNGIGLIGSGLESGLYVGNTNFAIWTRTGNKLALYNNGADRLTIESNGNVGIGTTTPNNKLTVSQPLNDNSNLVLGGFTREGTSTGGSALLRVGYYGTADFEVNGMYSGTGWRYGTWGDLNLVNNGWSTYGGINFVTQNTIRASILPNGNVGIGTTTPNYKLDIQRPADSNNNIILGNFKASGPFGGSAVVNIGYHNDTYLEMNSGYSGAGHRAGSTYGDFNIVNTVNDGTYGAVNFYTNNTHRMKIAANGNIGIGTTNPQTKLAVNGTITTKEVNVTLDGWADFVFHPTYRLRTLGEVEQFIKVHNHLPEIPTEAEVKANGVSLGEMNAKLLQKVEELTLYVIELKKENELQNREINELKERNNNRK